MGKQYKGWEIAKMISEGKLKDGSLLKANVFGDKKIKTVSKHLEFEGAKGDCLENELGTSFLTDENLTYEIIPEPVSFMEVVYSGKRCRVEYPNAPDGYWFLDDMLYRLGDENSSELCAEIIKEGKWYVEE